MGLTRGKSGRQLFESYPPIAFFVFPLAAISQQRTIVCLEVSARVVLNFFARPSRRLSWEAKKEGKAAANSRISKGLALGQGEGEKP